MRKHTLLTLLAAVTLPATLSAALVSVTGSGVIMDPATQSTGATANFFNDVGSNNIRIRGWDEKQNYTLTQNLVVDILNPGTYTSSNYTVNSFSLLAGTVVSSHLLFFDPQATHTRTARFEFDSDIIGLIVESGNSNATDKFFQSDYLGNVNTVYPASHYAARGIEFGPESITLEVGLRHLAVTLEASNPGDQIRVITAASPVPEPGTMALLGFCLLGLRGVFALNHRKVHGDAQREEE